MSDKETLIKMFERASIEYTDTTIFAKHGKSHIIIGRGYIGFSTWFSFSNDGSLENVEAGE